MYCSRGSPRLPNRLQSNHMVRLRSPQPSSTATEKDRTGVPSWRRGNSAALPVRPAITIVFIARLLLLHFQRALVAVVEVTGEYGLGFGGFLQFAAARLNAFSGDIDVVFRPLLALEDINPRLPDFLRVV